MYISLYDLGLFVLFAVLVVMGIYIIIVLRRVLCTLGLVHGILTEHRGDISKTVSLFQETLTHVNDLTLNLKEVADQTNKTVHSLPGEIIDTVDDLRESLEAFALYGRIVVEVIKMVFSKRD